MYSPLVLIYALCTIFAINPFVSASPIDNEERANPGPRRPTHIKASLYDRLRFYTKHASASYQGPKCPNPPYKSVMVDFIVNKTTTTQAVIYRNDNRTKFIVAFPGTRGPVDEHLDDEYALTPMDLYGVPPNACTDCYLHTGFRAAWMSIAPLVAKSLRNLMKGHPKYGIVLTGHSLGGAIASQATASLKGMNFPIAATFTFGQPRTGNPAYANYIDKISHAAPHRPIQMFRVVHSFDGVPHTPALEDGYRHHGTEIWEKDNPKTHNQSAAYTLRCYGQESPYCSDSTSPVGVINTPHGYYSDVNMGNAYVCH